MNRYAFEVRALKILRPLGIAFFVIVTVFPFLYMILLSVRDISEVIESPGAADPLTERHQLGRLRTGAALGRGRR